MCYIQNVVCRYYQIVYQCLPPVYTADMCQNKRITCITLTLNSDSFGVFASKSVLCAQHSDAASDFRTRYLIHLYQITNICIVTSNLRARFAFHKNRPQFCVIKHSPHRFV